MKELSWLLSLFAEF